MLLSRRWSERGKSKYRLDLIRKLGERKGAGGSFDRREERTDIFGSDGKYSQEVQADA
jgi:hypothetical protein